MNDVKIYYVKYVQKKISFSEALLPAQKALLPGQKALLPDRAF